MAVIEFSQFSQRRAERTRLERNDFPAATVLADRWAQLHAAPTEARVEEVLSDSDAPDFFGDLLFRLAYPTHRLRTH